MCDWKKKKHNASRIRFVDIGLENVVVAAARVVELPSRSGLKKVQKRRCRQNVSENHFSIGSRANSADAPRPALIYARIPIASYVRGITKYIYIYVYIYDLSARPQTRDLFKIGNKTSLPGSGSKA